MTENLCPECKGPFRGRVDKKFCSDSCRNTYNNRINSDVNKYIRNVNNLLRKNRRILNELKAGKKTVHKSELEKKNFDFQFFTNIYTTKNGHTYYFCYDHGYRELENDYYMLVIKEEYV